MIIERAGAPAHVVGSSMGASISLRLAAERPGLIRTLQVHEPPLFDLLLDDPKTRPQTEELKNRFLAVADEIAAGNIEAAARRFVEMYFGPGTWDTFLPDEARHTLINNAPTFLDETRDPEVLSIDANALARFSNPVLLTGGFESPPFCAPVLDKLAGAFCQTPLVRPSLAPAICRTSRTRRSTSRPSPSSSTPPRRNAAHRVHALTRVVRDHLAKTRTRPVKHVLRPSASSAL